jgi:hypothetical protein
MQNQTPIQFHTAKGHFTMQPNSATEAHPYESDQPTSGEWTLVGDTVKAVRPVNSLVPICDLVFGNEAQRQANGRMIVAVKPLWASLNRMCDAMSRDLYRTVQPQMPEHQRRALVREARGALALACGQDWLKDEQRATAARMTDLREFVAQIARMSTDDEIEDGMSGDDAASTISVLIMEARELLETITT